MTLKIFQVFVLFFIITISAFAFTNATITQLAGKVEIKLSSGNWIPAEVGMTIDTGTIISTGFRSSLILEVGSSTLDIKPLTRMIIDELFTDSNGLQNTRLSLRVGKIKFNVRTTENISHDFSIRSPTSTAAVRGTIFSFDGQTIEVEEGLVTLGTGVGHNVNAGPNEMAIINSNGTPQWAKNTNENRSYPGDRGRSSEHANRGRGKGPGWKISETPEFGSVNIEWRF